MSPTEAPAERVTLADGRRLAYCMYGDPGGRPVLYCHGFPGSRLEAAFAAAAAGHAGIRLLAPDRPGFGRSDPRGDCALDEWSEDAVALLDALDVTRAGLLGVSGGAPYALGCAARLPRRFPAIALIGPLGPVDGPGGSAGMSPLARLGFALARRAPGLQALLFGAMAAAIRISPEAAFRALVTNLAAADRTVFEDPAMRGIWIDSLRAAVEQGAGAAVSELRRYARPWPFEPAAIRVRAAVWHGDADRVVPMAHGRRLARRLPCAETHWHRGEGHFSLPVKAIGEVLAWLRQSAERAAQPW